MKKTITRIVSVLLLLPLLFMTLAVTLPPSDPYMDAAVRRNMPAPGLPAFAEKELQERINAPLMVALVFGRAKGCTEAEPELINLVAREAVANHVPPKVLASLVATESQCNPMAISSKGAIGLTQVMPHTWADKFDFQHKYNLFNANDNVHVGARILAIFIHERGLTGGVHQYNGMGVGCGTCPPNYVGDVLTLARVGKVR